VIAHVTPSEFPLLLVCVAAGVGIGVGLGLAWAWRALGRSRGAR
jgi:hypothetical protein